ncbi:MAG TPA: cupin domain-containing protein, partial [Reyranellaceae bacterium]|nr:cupin domain-containing protein [Reyranellaceae bacterium]
MAEALHFLFDSDGDTPNNPRLPLILYRGAVAVAGARDPAALFEELFGKNGWGGGWRNGIFGFRHFHPSGHEVLGIASGTAEVEFGGSAGQAFQLNAGDVAVLPAGMGHKRLGASRDLLVVGAYPTHNDWAHVRPGEIGTAEALKRIARVPVTDKDPVHGGTGPLL